MKYFISIALLCINAFGNPYTNYDFKDELEGIKGEFFLSVSVDGLVDLPGVPDSHLGYYFMHYRHVSIPSYRGEPNVEYFKLANQAMGFAKSHNDLLVEKIRLSGVTDDSRAIEFASPLFDYLIFVEADGRHLVALDSKGQVVWRRNPFQENSLEPYRYCRPVITEVYTLRNRNDEPVLAIRFNSSQFGYVDVLTGDFTFEGQD